MTSGTADTDAGARPHAARHLVLAGLVLGLLADTALRRMSDGLGWTLWVVGLALAAALLAQRQPKALTAEAAAWLGAAIACAAAFAWRDAEQLRVSNVLGTLVALALFAMAASGRPAASLLVARIRDVVAAGLYTIRDIVAGTPLLIARDAALHAAPPVRAGALGTVLRSVALTAPVLLVFIILLSRADPVFASIFALPEIDLEQALSRLIVAGAFAWWSAGFLRGALLGVAWRPSLPEQLPVRLGSTEITTALGAVIGLFTVFVALQLRWLFGGAEVVLATTGLTVAEYARRGFFELVLVTALVVPFVLITGSAVQDEEVGRRHRHLSLLLILLLAAIMVSAMLRMRLYVSHFGLTTDRLFAAAIMGWLAIVVASMAFTVLGTRPRAFAAITVLGAFLTLFSLNVADNDRLVARVNLGRASADREIDYRYLARLSGDAMPIVAPALAAAKPSEDACRAAKALRRRWLRPQEAAWNVGARRGRAAVREHVTPARVQHLCVGTRTDGAKVPTQPASG